MAVMSARYSDRLVTRFGAQMEPLRGVAHTAEAFNADVCPHFLMELHVSHAAAVPNGKYEEHIPQLRAITKGVVTAGPEEVRRNRRARSAKLRVAEKLA